MKVESSHVSVLFETLTKLNPAPEDEAEWSKQRRAVAEAEAGSRIALARAENYEDFVLQRKKYARYFVAISSLWLVFVAIVIFLDAWSIFSFALGENVLIALLGTATLKVLAPAYLVAKYLFGDSPD